MKSESVAPRTATRPADWLKHVRKQVAVHAPVGRDASLAVKVLSRWGIEAVECPDVGSMCEALGAGVAVLVLAEEALTPAARDQLQSSLAAQPSWSDIPIVVLTAEGELSRSITEGVERLATSANVILLERPVRIATLVTALRSALRARTRQYEIADHLAERERLLASERRARGEAEHANRAKSEFLAVMSHELRTPLNAIGGYTELLELGVHGDITAAQRDALSRIKQSERHLLGLINGVLNYARVETGNTHYDITSVPLDELVTLAEALVAPQVRSRSQKLIVKGCGDDTAMLADREKAQQIVLNLLSNAIKFTPDGGSIGILCTASKARVRVAVTDTGVGIPADKLERIFEPFIQVDSRLTRTSDGVGLGLAISRDLARGMGGDLTVKSEVGKGSRFELTLRRSA